MAVSPLGQGHRYARFASFSKRHHALAINPELGSSRRSRFPSSGLAEAPGLEKRPAIVTMALFASQYPVLRTRNLIHSLARKLLSSLAYKPVRSHTSPFKSSQGPSHKLTSRGSSEPCLARARALPHNKLQPRLHPQFPPISLRRTRGPQGFMKQLRLAGSYNKLIVSFFKCRY